MKNKERIKVLEKEIETIKQTIGLKTEGSIFYATLPFFPEE